MADNSILSSLKPTAGGVVSAALSGLFFIGTILVNYSGQTQKTKDQIVTLQTDVQVLKDQVGKDMATRREVDAFKVDTGDRLTRIEDKLDRELAFHHK